MSDTNHTNDGGPAFPVFRSDQAGMSLRDWFAGQALNGYLSTERTISAAIEGSEDNRLSFSSYLAQLSYETADAMIAASNNSPS